MAAQGNATATAGGAGGNATTTAAGAQGQQAGAGSAGATSSLDPEVVNEMLSHYLLLVLGSISAALLVWRLGTVLVKYVRTVSCLNNETQRYFAKADGKLSFFKRNILYSPIFRKRHNREFQLSPAVNVGTLPTRMQLVFLAGYFATNIAFCVLTIDFSGSLSQVASLVRNRTGYLAVVNMIPLFLMAGRNNPLIKLLGISFDTFNLLHRWIGRIVALEALAHALAFFVGSASKGSWAAAFQTTIKVPYLLYGFIVRHPSLGTPFAVLCN
jgi:hypothetical protein